MCEVELKRIRRRAEARFFAILADRAHGDLLVLVVHVHSVIIGREFAYLPLSAWLIVLPPSLEQLHSWFIAERPPRDPAAVSTHGRRPVTYLGADCVQGADRPAKRRQILKSI